MEKFYEGYSIGYDENNLYRWIGMIETTPGIFKSGTKEDYDNHNRKVAYGYIALLENEEFSKLHNFSMQVISKILMSITDDEKYSYYQNGLSNGTLITKKGISLLDAILEKKAVDLAIIYIIASIRDFRLHALYIMYKMINYNEEESLFSSVICDFTTKSEYTEYLQNILINIEELYRKIKSNKEKKYVLNNVAEAIKHAHVSFKFGKIELNFSDFQYGEKLKKTLISKNK